MSRVMFFDVSISLYSACDGKVFPAMAFSLVCCSIFQQIKVLTTKMCAVTSEGNQNRFHYAHSRPEKWVGEKQNIRNEHFTKDTRDYIYESIILTEHCFSFFESGLEY